MLDYNQRVNRKKLPLIKAKDLPLKTYFVNINGNRVGAAFFKDEDSKITRLTDGVYVTNLFNRNDTFVHIVPREEAIHITKQVRTLFGAYA